MADMDLENLPISDMEGLSASRISSKIHFQLSKDFGVTSFAATLPSAQKDFLTLLCDAIAVSVVDEIKSHSKLEATSRDAQSAIQIGYVN